MATSPLSPARFYTGLVVDLYEPLAVHLARADDYVGFVERSGQPALELGCGSGHPLLEMVRRGYDVDGVDASDEMLARLRRRAAELGIDVRVYEQEMQRMSLPRRYRSVFLAGLTFTLLTTDDDARLTLERMHEHLLPGGSVLIPLSIPDGTRMDTSIGRLRETTLADGTCLRFEVRSVQLDAEARRSTMRLRYERIQPDGSREELERDFLGSWWPPKLFHSMLAEAGFVDIRATRWGGGELMPGDTTFTFRAFRGDC
jgi:SAM-dependent methyltransferase